MTAIPIGSEFLVNTVTAGSQSDQSIAMDARGDFVVTWTSAGQDGGGNGIYAQRYNLAGEAQGSEFQVNTFTAGDQQSSAVAMDARGDFVVTWTSAGQDGGGNGIYAQRYNLAGEAQGSEFQVNTFTTGDQQFSAVAMDARGDFVVTWASAGQDGGGNGIYAQRYNLAGEAQGSEFQVNTFTAGDQQFSAVAMDANGDFVVTWQSAEQDGNGLGIYAQRYNAAGVAQGGEFRVNTFTTGDQSRSSIAMDARGNFVVTWVSAGQDGSRDGVYAQRYNAAGVAQGGEFQVNTFTAGNQNFPKVAMDANGKFAITWTSFQQDGDFGGIYAQRYDAAGVAQGGEFLVNTTTANTQAASAIAMDTDGDFAIAWNSFLQDGSLVGGYAQRYRLPSQVSFTQAAYQVNEAGTLTEAITLTRTNALVQSQVQVAITGGTATTGADYDATGFPLTVTFAPGETSKTVTLPIVRDTVAEDTETVTLSLTALSETTIGTQSTATLSILDGDSRLDFNSLGNDTITGSLPGNDRLNGGQGNDTIRSGGGNDRLAGGKGNDVMDGGVGKDTLNGGQGGDTLRGGSGADNLTGGSGNDTLEGNGGSDTLNGNDGDDLLDGGKGNDTMTGGNGRDRFVLRIGEGNLDVIQDYDADQDRLALAGQLRPDQLVIRPGNRRGVTQIFGDGISTTLIDVFPEQIQFVQI